MASPARRLSVATPIQHEERAWIRESARGVDDEEPVRGLKQSPKPSGEGWGGGGESNRQAVATRSWRSNASFASSRTSQATGANGQGAHVSSPSNMCGSASPNSMLAEVIDMDESIPARYMRRKTIAIGTCIPDSPRHAMVALLHLSPPSFHTAFNGSVRLNFDAMMRYHAKLCRMPPVETHCMITMHLVSCCVACVS